MDDLLLDAGDDSFVEAYAEEAHAGEGDSTAEGAGLLPPRQNPYLFGQEDAEKALLGLYLAGRLPHALILSGPPGIGKATLAFRLARFLLSSGGRDQAAGVGLFGDAAPPTSLHVAPENPVFKRVASGGHADLLTVERVFDEKKGAYKNEIAVDDVRKVAPFLRMTASEGGWRVVIVDGAEDLNLNGQNALLKILEEPPEKAVLILTTSRPGLFLPTIRSRCRTVACRSLPEGVILKLLDEACGGLAAAEKKALARLSGGSIGHAIELYRQGGLELYKGLISVIGAGQQWEAIHKMADQMGQPGADSAYKTTMNLLSGWLMRMARATSRGVMPEIVMDEEKAIVQELSRRKSPQGWLEAWEKVTQLVRQTDDFSLDRKETVLEVFTICGSAG